MDGKPLAIPPLPPPGPTGSDEELQWRLSLIGTDEDLRGVVFNSILEVVRQLGDEHAVERCLQVAGEPRFMDFFNYPFASLIKMTYTAARLLSDKYGGFDKALWKMSQQSVSSVYSSPAGRAVLLLGRGGPTRLLDTLVSAFAMTSKHVEVSVQLTGPKSAIFTYKRDYMPRPYTEGGLVATFDAAQVKGMKIHARPTGPLDTEYDLSWS